MLVLVEVLFTPFCGRYIKNRILFIMLDIA